MQTRTYGDLFKLVQSLAGVNSFTSAEQSDIAAFINRRYFQAYNESLIWVRYIVPSEERTLASFRAFNADLGGVGTSELNGLYQNIGKLAGTISGLKLGTPVYRNENGAVFFNTVSGWIGSINASVDTTTVEGEAKLNSSGSIQLVETNGDGSTANPYNVRFGRWTPSIAADGDITMQTLTCVPFAQSGLDTIGDVIRVHRNKALVKNSAIEYDFFVDVNGVNILNIVDSNANSVYVTYKKPFTKFTTSSDYLNSTEKVPEEFFAFIAHTAYADFLRMDGQHQKALLEEQTAKGALDLQLERNDIISNNNNVNIKFSTYVSRQSR
jgi:hypothetical protein